MYTSCTGSFEPIFISDLNLNLIFISEYANLLCLILFIRNKDENSLYTQRIWILLFLFISIFIFFSFSFFRSFFIVNVNTTCYLRTFSKRVNRQRWNDADKRNSNTLMFLLCVHFYGFTASA